MIGGHLTWVLGSELVASGKTGCGTNGSDLYPTHSFVLSLVQSGSELLHPRNPPASAVKYKNF